MRWMVRLCTWMEIAGSFLDTIKFLLIIVNYNHMLNEQIYTRILAYLLDLRHFDDI